MRLAKTKRGTRMGKITRYLYLLYLFLPSYCFNLCVVVLSSFSWQACSVVRKHCVCHTESTIPGRKITHHVYDCQRSRKSLWFLILSCSIVWCSFGVLGCIANYPLPVALVGSRSQHFKCRSKFRWIVMGHIHLWLLCICRWFKLGLNCDQNTKNQRLQVLSLKPASPTSDHCSSWWAEENYIISQRVRSLSSPLCVSVHELANVCVCVRVRV